MSPASERDLIDRLRDGIEAYADAEAAALLAEAQIEARAKVRALLVETIAQRLLERADEKLTRDQVGPGPGGQGALVPQAATRGRPAGGPSVREPHGGNDAGAPESIPREMRSQPAPAAETPAAARSGGTTALYVYGVVAADEVADDQLAAVVSARCPLELVQGGTIAAVTSPVGLDEFGEAELRARVEDLDWLEQTARGHEHVLEQIQEWATVVPMRLCTVYRTRESLREMLLEREPLLVEALARLSGRTEWGVKAFVVDAPDTRAQDAHPAGPDAQTLPAPEPGAGRGAAYMRERRRESQRSERAAQAVQAVCEDAHARLAAIAVDAVLNRLQPPELANHPGDMVLNGVYLVRDDEHDDFAAEVLALQREHGADGFQFELTGPWPPYNFVGEAFEVAR